MRAVLAVSLLVSFAACADEGDTDPDPQEPIPATCPSQNVEVCLIGDGPWMVDCEYGQVTLYDGSRLGYCAPGKHDVLCETEPLGPQILETCADQCSDEVKLFDTYDEYQQFDPSSLCL